MTQSGSLAYYSVAVVVGSFALSATYFVNALVHGAGREHLGRDFLFVYFFALILGMIPLVVSAWFLRRLAWKFGWKTAWPWMLAGAVLFLLAVWALGAAGGRLEKIPGIAGWKSALMLLLLGTMIASQQPFWVPLLSGAVTGYMLYRVQCAFAS